MSRFYFPKSCFLEPDPDGFVIAMRAGTFAHVGPPLGIPTVRDRVTQQTLLQILEPIFEAKLGNCSYGFC